MIKLVRNSVFLLFLPLFMVSATASVIENYQFEHPDQQARFLQLTTELRCPQCQNQSIADSNASISEDLRREVYRMINEGQDDQIIIDFMLARYGEFVLYKPRIKAETLLLWFGPLVLLLLALTILVVLLKKHRRPEVEVTSLNQVEQAELDKILGGKQ